MSPYSGVVVQRRIEQKIILETAGLNLDRRFIARSRSLPDNFLEQSPVRALHLYKTSVADVAILGPFLHFLFLQKCGETLKKTPCDLAIHWVARGTGTPKDRYEVNRRDVCECHG
jgi:hypothetical protein